MKWPPYCLLSVNTNSETAIASKVVVQPFKVNQSEETTFMIPLQRSGMFASLEKDLH